MTAPIDVLNDLAQTVVTTGGTTLSDTAFVVNSSALFINVANSAANPPTQFRIVDIANPTEIMTVTEMATTSHGTNNDWTVTRGPNPVAHTTGWTAMGVVTVEGLDNRYGALFGSLLEDFIFQQQWVQMAPPNTSANMNQQTHTNYLTPDGVYGDGSDGSVTFDGSTAVTGFTLAGSTYVAARETNFVNVTIDNGITVDLFGFRIFVSGILTGIGTATIGSFSVLGIGFAAGTVAGSQSGVTGNTSTGSAPATLTNSLGGAGGAGGSGGAGTGGTAAAPTPPAANAGSVRALPWAVLAAVHSASVAYTPVAGGQAGSSGAGNGAGNVGGSSGFGGPVVVVVAKIIAGSLTIGANGGTGATPTGTNCGGGGGGGGGLIIIVSNTPAVPTTSVNGGAGGAKTGTGVAGSAGAVGTVILVPC